MHIYSSDGEERRVVPFVLAAASIGVALGLRSLVARLGYAAEVNVSILSSFGIYGMLHLVFDRYAWRWRVVRLLGGSTVPDLEGRWKGTLKSSHSGLTREHEVELEIVQTWSKINILLESQTSRSESQMAVIKTSAPTRHEVVWEYVARSKNAGQGDSFLHFGVTRLAVHSPTAKAEGSYYTEQKRDTYGTVQFAKVESDG
jgi:hypothetical protein